MEKFPNKSTILDIQIFEKFSMIFVEMAWEAKIRMTARQKVEISR